jgi:hypothetical protein
MQSNEYRHSREMLSQVNDKSKLKKLVRLSKSQLKQLIQITTGHCLFAKHLSQWRRQVDPTCRMCQEDMETPAHLLKLCPALSMERMQWQLSIENSTSPIAEEVELLKFFNNKHLKDALIESL